MDRMFNFLQDIDNYDDRCIGRYPPEGDFLVDTAAVSDGRLPYETAIKHPEYNDGNMIIVEAYPNKEGAQAGHEKWIKTMITEPLPEVLVDCKNAELMSLYDEELSYPRVKIN